MVLVARICITEQHPVGNVPASFWTQAFPVKSLKMVWARMQVNNGVYKSGFATTQAAYERAQSDLWTWLDILEDKLSKQRFLTGSRYAQSSHMQADVFCRVTVDHEFLYSVVVVCQHQLYLIIVSCAGSHWQICSSSQQLCDLMPHMQHSSNAHGRGYRTFQTCKAGCGMCTSYRPIRMACR